MRSFLSCVAAAGLALLVLGASATWHPPQEKPAPEPLLIPLPKGEGPLLVLSGNDIGFIRPCGCSKPALGGIHRRATVIEELRRRQSSAGKKICVISTGDLVSEGGRQQQMKFETFLLAMSEMGYQAFCPGPGDLKLGIPFLLQARELGGFPFVVANLESKGEALGVAWLRLPEGILLTGILPEELKEADYRGSSIGEALKPVLSELKAGERLVISYGGKAKDLPRLARLIPAELRGRTTLLGRGDDAMLMDPVDGATLVAMGSKGRVLQFLRLGAKKPFREMILRERIPAHEMVSEILNGYRMMVKEEGFVEKVPKRAQEIAYLGDGGCIECHEESCGLLEGSHHRRAFKALEATGDEHDPECVRCHVTGWAEVGGYLSAAKTPQFKNVGCEACHGPGEVHAQTQELMPRSKPLKVFCQNCHDPNNSPHFNFEKYWPKILHPPR